MAKSKSPKSAPRSGGPQKSHGNKKTAAAQRAKQEEAKRQRQRDAIAEAKGPSRNERRKATAPKQTQDHRPGMQRVAAASRTSA
ncbi:MAG TPA: hypothetical protein VFM68_02360 [Candidatus Saccharimonadales bacterium]|nr:hypothetical protein [Candidatus Saccharimonadales bacterium]